ncbi:MAG: 1-acyl-sn-glycerol-3-phosphate acyltransferase [Halopseudomonas sp.]|uniref:1-acyl-sn-glycerol-3-phosphate acyltransferase n=1 Tax=Halopseudomonas sp. TaxID=2901191 RepID=UPI0030017408
MGEFDAIRPYDDAEVPVVMERLLSDQDLMQMLAVYRFPRLSRWCPGLLKRAIQFGLRREARGIRCVDTLQHRIEPYLDRLIESSTLQVTYSGLEHLREGQAYLFLANHRDIAMDPAFVNYALYHAGHPTPRVAIGDNLLQRPFVADLMRLNKCFIVHRSLTGRRDKLRAYQTMSAYISHSLQQGQSIWIAQAEGRAKDGLDETDPAIIKMFCMSRKGEDFASVIRSLQLVPVSIAYEWDPCDAMKARELEQKARLGEYRKQPGEDDRSIAKGLTGYKGRVHVAFGQALEGDFADAKAVARAVDRQILTQYRLFPSNYLALEQQGELPADLADWRGSFAAQEVAVEEQRFAERLAEIPARQQPYWLLQYANPVHSRLRVLAKQ